MTEKKQEQKKLVTKKAQKKVTKQPKPYDRENIYDKGDRYFD